MLDKKAIEAIRLRGELSGIGEAVRDRLSRIRCTAYDLRTVSIETPRMKEDLVAIERLAAEALLLRDEWLTVAAKNK